MFPERAKKRALAATDVEHAARRSLDVRGEERRLARSQRFGFGRRDA